MVVIVHWRNDSRLFVFFECGLFARRWPIVQDEPPALPADSTTQSGDGDFIFGDDEPEITIPLDMKSKITNSTDI